VTPTVDPTLAAQFIREIPATRLPTFTPPGTLAIPTFTAEQAPVNTTGPVTIYLVGALVVIGLLGIMLSYIRVR
jgi:hypothetical protein